MLFLPITTAGKKWKKKMPQKVKKYTFIGNEVDWKRFHFYNIYIWYKQRSPISKRARDFDTEWEGFWADLDIIHFYEKAYLDENIFSSILYIWRKRKAEKKYTELKSTSALLLFIFIVCIVLEGEPIYVLFLERPKRGRGEWNDIEHGVKSNWLG